MRLLGLVISVGLADSMNPSTIAPALYLATGDCAKRDLIQFILGSGGIYLVGGLLIVAGPGEALLAVVPHPGALTRYILETVAGAVVLAVGIVLMVRRHRMSDRQLPQPKAGGGRSAFVLGATIMLVEIPTAFPYFAVIAAVVGSGLGLGTRLLLIVIYNLCFVAPLLAILLTVVIAGDRAGPILARGRDFLQRRWPLLLAILAVVAGAFVAVLGVSGIIGRGRSGAAGVSRQLRHLITKG
ncbi:MAG TPA: GAP family protein [Solirubrobacteraceae bacterium]|nr:GAP family protein [Solirubrobacteraceae bacterium]